MVPSRSGRTMLIFETMGLIFFLLSPISYAFIKTNIIIGDNYNPSSLCELSFFLEYFGYEIGNLFISIYLIYRLYSSFDNSLYHIKQKYVNSNYLSIYQKT